MYVELTKNNQKSCQDTFCVVFSILGLIHVSCSVLEVGYQLFLFHFYLIF